MAWMNLEQASQTGTSRSVWEERIQTKAVPAYLDHETGEQMVWAGQEEPTWALELVARVRQEVSALRSSLGTPARRAPVRRVRPRTAMPGFLTPSQVFRRAA